MVDLNGTLIALAETNVNWNNFKFRDAWEALLQQSYAYKRMTCTRTQLWIQTAQLTRITESRGLLKLVVISCLRDLFESFAWRLGIICKTTAETTTSPRTQTRGPICLPPFPRFTRIPNYIPPSLWRGAVKLERPIKIGCPALQGKEENGDIGEYVYGKGCGFKIYQGDASVKIPMGLRSSPLL